MPIHVDRDERRALLARAVWRIVARDGVQAASVRAVAREAGLSMGSIRHFFRAQDELIRFAMAELGEQVRRRIEDGRLARVAAVAEGRLIDAAVSVLEEILPLDAPRWTEARVWAAFTAPPVTDEQIGEIRRHADDDIRQLCRSVLAELHQTGELHPERDLDVETERMHALVDGLTIHLALDPTRVSTGSAKSVLLLHLNDVKTEPIK